VFQLRVRRGPAGSSREGATNSGKMDPLPVAVAVVGYALSSKSSGHRE